MDKPFMNSMSATRQEPEAEEPRWPAVVALLAVGGLYLAVPESLSVGPRWLLLIVVGALLIPTIVTHQRGHTHWNQIFGFLATGAVTLAMLGSLTLLVLALPQHKEKATDLLRSAGALWMTNVLVFALWYWRLDAGGPNQRDLKAGHTDGAFLFPQMAMDDDVKRATNQTDWSPSFVDYLFLAFNTSTALSPTDTAVLSRWAKFLTMIQALISLTIIALLAARAVNILS